MQSSYLAPPQLVCLNSRGDYLGPFVPPSKQGSDSTSRLFLGKESVHTASSRLCRDAEASVVRCETPTHALPPVVGAYRVSRSASIARRRARGGRVETWLAWVWGDFNTRYYSSASALQRPTLPFMPPRFGVVRSWLVSIGTPCNLYPFRRKLTFKFVHVCEQNLGRLECCLVH